FAHHADHNLYPVAPTYCAHEVDTVQVCYPLDLAAVAGLTGASAQEVLDLNPTFKRGVVPDVDEPVAVYLPKRSAGVFVANESELQYSYEPKETSTPEPAAAVEQASATTRYHTVRRGESLGVIANRYGLGVSELKRMNGLRGDLIRAGQKLAVGRTKAPVAKAAPKENDATEYIYHVVQPGDTLWDIANRYPGVTVDDLKRLNNALLQREGLKPGHKIKVAVPQG
ncbi:MAG: LysM peptidoglycan-binding domain-containing protein, partial [Flavobacteriales bacterium]|nr:LysM peptidoglycan-binding domain-containing protein [Flavobacteriales bacterium]